MEATASTTVKAKPVSSCGVSDCNNSYRAASSSFMERRGGFTEMILYDRTT